jgi:TPR repeat protein
METFEFDAFISYSHRDLTWAKWLQEKLETFHIPDDAGEAFANRRRMRVFRDQTDLAGVEVTASLRRELRASRFLVVVCSPNSAASRWVNDEVAYFEDLGRQDNIIPFIVSGEPDSDRPELECYPPRLRSTDERAVLGANVQEIGKTKALLKVVSLLIDVRFNRLVDREKQRKRRNAVVAASILLALSATLTALLVNNADISRRNKALSRDVYGAAIVAFAQKEVLSPEDFDRIRESAEAGNAYAATLLGDCYGKGWGVQRDDAQAVAWYRRGAEAGDTMGMVALANCYLFGTGVGVDEEQSFQWNMRAAKAGSPEGMLNVALDYEGGHGVPETPEAAFMWYSRAATVGYDLAMYNLARCYRTGYGTLPSPERAFFWMKKLAKTGNTEAMYNLAMMYQKGYGTAENPEQAYAWYRRAADAGDADAQYMTGWCLENRYGVEDPALEWYARSALAGNENAAKALEGRETASP